MQIELKFELGPKRHNVIFNNIFIFLRLLTLLFLMANQKPTLPRYSENIRAHQEYKSYLTVNRESFGESFDFDQ